MGFDAADIIKLVKEQQVLQDQLISIHENAAKLAIPKRTFDAYVKAQSRAKAVWDNFVENHDVLDQLPDKNIKYFADDAFEKTKKVYDDFTNYTNGMLKTITNPTAPATEAGKKGPDGESMAKDLQLPTVNVTQPQDDESNEPRNDDEFITPRGTLLENPFQRFNPLFAEPNNNDVIQQLLDHIKTSDTRNEKKDEDEASRRAPYIKMPTFDVPKFTGTVKSYKTFRETFMSIIGRSKATDIEKFVFLKSKLEDDPLSMVNHLTLNGVNYKRAWDMLNDRFINDRLLIQEELYTLIDLPKLKPKNAESLRSMINMVEEIKYNLAELTIDTTSWDPIVSAIIMRKMDSDTRDDFEDALDDTKIMPPTSKVLRFMKKRVEKFDALKGADEAATQKTERPSNSTRKEAAQTLVTNSADGEKKRGGCLICNENHYAATCPLLTGSNDKIELLRQHKICMHCVSHYYKYGELCRKRGRVDCAICHENHPTVLHKIKREPATTTMMTEATYLSKNQIEGNESSAILPTLLATFVASDGSETVLRCLADQCSTASYITEREVQKLKLRRKKTCVEVAGVGGIVSNRISSLAVLKLKTPNGEILKIKALIIKTITSSTPAYHSMAPATLKGKKLADPTFNRPGGVSVLLSGAVMANLFEAGQEKHGNLLAQNTKLGLIISGASATDEDVQQKVSTMVTMSELENELRLSWDLPIAQTEDDIAVDEKCLKEYKEKHFRDEDGRYVVPTLWKEDAPKLGDSYTSTAKFFLAQETKLLKNPELKAMSDAFMQEYIDLGHMKEIQKEDMYDGTGNAYYIKYIAVLRQDAVTTKLRNVFNASAPSSNGVSLNDCINQGPALQQSITEILTRIRRFKIMFSSDITKMYRQIKVVEEDKNKLRVLWRPHRADPLKEYRLQTVTYGVNCSSFLAISTVRQAAEDNAKDPLTKWILQSSTYMDDIYWGSDTVSEGKKIVKDITDTLLAAKLPLSKWTSNNNAVLEDVPDDKKLANMSDKDWTKALGVMLYLNEDEFGLNVKDFNNATYTKRGLLKITASIFDPLGFALPVVMKLRMLLQELWLKKYSWDQPIDAENAKKFRKVIDELPLLKDLRIRRWLGTVQSSEIELIGFSDASGDGICAMVFGRVKTDVGWEVNLLASRGRVTPLKTRENGINPNNTIPKMELEGLLLLTQLITDVKQSFETHTLRTTCYTDSEICVYWIRSKKEKVNKFVKRRIETIRQRIGAEHIHHVRTGENPSDPGSRGLLPAELMSTSGEIWFNGPHFLRGELPKTEWSYKETEEMSNQEYESDSPDAEADDDVDKITIRGGECNAVQSMITTADSPITSRFSSWNRMLRVISRILRWRNNAKQGETSKLIAFDSPLSSNEIDDARTKIIKIEQTRYFNDEIKSLKREKNVTHSSPLCALSPFLHKQTGIMHVGGRLENANLPFLAKHQILIPRSSPIASMIVRDIHTFNNHCGKSTTEQLVREKYWIVRLQSKVKTEIRSCTICTRFAARSNQPMMADLPEVRVVPSIPFSHVGIDLCGDFSIKASPLRFDKTMKAWIVVFICMFTKAVHLEVCLGLSAEVFLAAFARFCSRRGTPSHVYSDNGGNFVSASKQLKETWEKINDNCKDVLATKAVNWKFIPAFAPNQGGLWERAVRSVKGLLKRSAETHSLTLDEFETIICKIEGAVNSRPLFPSSNDPNEVMALTPAHLTIQRTIQAPLENDVSNEKIPVTKRWMLVQQIQQKAWDIMKAEYLQTLQKKYKWLHHGRPPTVGDIVILKEPHTPPTHWPLARITVTHPDVKGIVRNVEVKTANDRVKTRAVNQLVPLTREEDDLEAEKRVLKPPTRARTATRPTASTLLATIICIAIAQSATSAKSELIHVLSPGIHVLKVGEAALQTLSLTLSINSGLNATDDCERIFHNVKVLRDMCESLKEADQETIDVCTKHHTAVEYEAETAKKKILQPVIKQKRWAPLVVWGTMGVLSVVSLSGTVAYQQMKINEVQNQINEANAKMKKMGHVLLNITESDHQLFHEHLDDLVKTQAEIQARAGITDLASQITEFITIIAARHEALEKPLPSEVYTEITRRNLTAAAKDNIFPRTKEASELFFINKPSRLVTFNGTVLLVHTVPMIGRKRFYVYQVLSVADETGKRVKLDCENPHQEIAMDERNATFFYIEGSSSFTTSAGQRIFTDVAERRANSCTFAAAKQRRATNNRECETIMDPTSSWAIIRPSTVFIMQQLNDTIKLSCEKTDESSQARAALVIMSKGCQLQTKEFLYRAKTSETMELKLSSIPITDVIPEHMLAVDINKGEKEFNVLISNAEDIVEEEPGVSFRPYSTMWTCIAVGSSIAVVIAMVICYAVMCSKKEGNAAIQKKTLSTTDVGEPTIIDGKMWTVPLRPIRVSDWTERVEIRD